MQKPTLENWLFLIVLGCIWGGSFIGVSVALRGFAPIWVAALRILIAAMILLCVLYATGRRLPGTGSRDRLVWLAAIGMGIFTNALPFTLLSWGQLFVASSFAGVTMAAVPLLILPLAHFLVPGEKMTGRKALGFAIGFTGVVILIGPATILSSTGQTLEPLARLACIGAAFCYAIGSIITRLAPTQSMLGFATSGLLVGGAMILPIAWYQAPLSWPQTQEVLGAILYLGALPTALATIMLVRVIKTAGPSFMSLVNYQVPVWAVIFGVWLLDEALPPSFLVAFGLILLGLAISQFKRKTA